jgi:AcrR family transcriptional regulator
MARTARIDNDHLLEAARAAFLEHGIRATSVAIARRAGVSPGILFHRFGSKEALFAAAIGEGKDAAREPLHLDLLARVGKGSVKETLTTLGDLLLDRYFLVVPNHLMAWANRDPASRASLAEKYRERGIRRQRVLVEYLRAEAQRQRLRPIDPFVIAQIFCGALWFFAFEQVIVGNQRASAKPPARSEFVRRLVDTLWNGLRVPERGKA